MKQQGLEPVPVNIDIEKLEKWCKKRGLKNTGSARSEYVVEIGPRPV